MAPAWRSAARAALLRGHPGSGKSDLALRFLALPGRGAETAFSSPTIRSASSGKRQGTAARFAARDHRRQDRGARARHRGGAISCRSRARAGVRPGDRRGRTAHAGRALGTDRASRAGWIPAAQARAVRASAPLKLKLALLLAAPDNPELRQGSGLRMAPRPDKDSGLWLGGLTLKGQHDRRRHRHSRQTRA